MPDLLNVGIAAGVIIGSIWIAKERHDMRKTGKHSIPASYNGPQAAPVFGQRLPMPTSPQGLGWGFFAALLGCAVGSYVVVLALVALGLF